MTTQAETNVIKLAVDNPLATPEDVAAIEFDADPHFIGLKDNFGCMERHEEKLRSLAISSRFAITVLACTCDPERKAIALAAAKAQADDKANGVAPRRPRPRPKH